MYHIENYLLEAEFVLRALSDLSGADESLTTTDEVEDALKLCAADTVNPLVRHMLVTEVSSTLVGALSVGGDASQVSVAPSVAASVQAAAGRVDALAAGDFSLKRLEKLESALRAKVERQLKLTTPRWKKTYRGRDILSLFAHRHARVPYEVFRDSVLARMKDAGHRPAGMAKVLDAILADAFP